MSLVRNELIEGTFNLMFSDENLFRLFYSSLVWLLKRALVVAYGVPVGAFRHLLSQLHELSSKSVILSNCSSTLFLDG